MEKFDIIRTPGDVLAIIGDISSFSGNASLIFIEPNIAYEKSAWWSESDLKIDINLIDLYAKYYKKEKK